MPDETTPTHVLSMSAVRWGIDALGGQKLHPTFVMYLYLRKESRGGRLPVASASSEELLSLIQLPGNATKPYYFPLIDRGDRSGSPLPSFWRARNIPGSWSPGSILRQKRSAWMAHPDGGYAFPDDHLQRALDDLLFQQPVSAVALGCYFLRNDGFVLSGPPSVEDVVAAFRVKFDYPSPATDEEFEQLFTADGPADAELALFDNYAQDDSQAANGEAPDA